MSVYRPDSEVSKINKSAGIKPVKVSADTFEVIKTAKLITEASGGAFDIRIRPLTLVWDIFKNPNEVPNKKVIEKAVLYIKSGEILLNEEKNTVFLTQNNMAVDLGGIAKGFAAEKAAGIIKKAGIESALINFGGNIRLIGKDNKKKWSIGIQNPLSLRGSFLGILEAEDISVVTSGTNEQFIIKNQKRLHHIIDPQTGEPANSGLLSATVVACDSMLCDALATAVMVLGIEKSLPLLNKFKAQAVFAADDNKVFCTNGLRNSFKLTK